MFTKCAHCETRFRIHSEQLKAAQGLVRCANCNEIFNALDNLEEDGADEAADNSPVTPPTLSTDEVAPLPEPTAAAPAAAPASPRWHHWLANLIWTLGILILITLALAQTAWYYRDNLLKYDESRNLLESYCAYAGCTIPPKRALERIKIVDRLVASHPETDGFLRIQITFENQAPFHQPFPILQISLFSGEGELEAQRRLSPDEYTGVPTRPDDIMQPGQRVDVELDVQDPGPHVTGFEFAFF